MAKNVDDLRNVQVALTPHSITLDKKSESNLTLEVYPELKRRGDINISENRIPITYLLSCISTSICFKIGIYI